MLRTRLCDLLEVDAPITQAPVWPARAYDVVPRVLRTEFVDRWHGRPDEAGAHADELRSEIIAALAERALHELVPFSGEAAGLIGEVLPAAAIVESMIADGETALQRASQLRR